jgi:hypothetical protein
MTPSLNTSPVSEKCLLPALKEDISALLTTESK